MNDLVRELARGLARADTDLALPGDAEVLFVHNVAAVPPTRSATTVTGGRSGFNVVLLDPQGAPTHFCKCRPSGDPDVAHEVAVVHAGSADAEVAKYLPRSALATTERLSACVSVYEDGRRYQNVIASQTTAAWAAAVEELTGITERMSARVAVAMPALLPGTPLVLADEARWALDHLATLQMAPKHRDALLRALLAGGSVPAALQHGDLWPANVLQRESGWLLLDLEGFGRITTPLYDLFHLLHTSFVQRRAGGESAHGMWVDALRDPGEDSTAARAILRRAVKRHELTPEAALAALVYYVVDLAARVHVRGVWGAWWETYVKEATQLAELLRKGASPVAFGFAAA